MPDKDNIFGGSLVLDFRKCWRYVQPKNRAQRKRLEIKATSTLIRFQTKTELFCPVFKNICVHTYRFRIVFTRPHYNAVSVLKTPLYPQCACSAELNACAFQYIGPRNWPHGSVFPPFWILTVEWSGAR